MKFVVYKKMVREETQIFGTEKAIRLPYSQKYFGRDIFPSNDFESVWLPRSQVEIYETSDGEHKYLNVKIPYWLLSSKGIYPDWIENFEGYEIVEQNKEK